MRIAFAMVMEFCLSFC